MKKVFLLILIAFISLTFQYSNAQQVNTIQRGQRGYTPPQKNSYNSAHVELIDPHNEVSIILPKCVEEFKLDDFEKEIFKGLLLKKFENQNAILEDEGNSREDRKLKIDKLEKSFYKDLALILTAEEIENYKLMDFTESREEKKQKKKKKRNKRKS